MNKLQLSTSRSQISKPLYSIRRIGLPVMIGNVFIAGVYLLIAHAYFHWH